MRCPGHVRQPRPMGLILLRLRSCARRSLCTTPLARAPRLPSRGRCNGTKRAAACAHQHDSVRGPHHGASSSPSSTRCGFARRRPAAGYTLSSPFSTRTHSGMIQAARSKACLQSGSSQQPCASFASNQPHVLPHGEAFSIYRAGRSAASTAFFILRGSDAARLLVADWWERARAPIHRALHSAHGTSSPALRCSGQSSCHPSACSTAPDAVFGSTCFHRRITTRGSRVCVRQHSACDASRTRGLRFGLYAPRDAPQARRSLASTLRRRSSTFTRRASYTATSGVGHSDTGGA